jgi:hypothetical protein
MNNLHKSYTYGIILILAGMPFFAQSHPAFDSHHATPISVVSSRNAAPTNVHVEERDGNVIISGALQRRHGQHLKVRGNVIVKIIGMDGKVVVSKSKTITSPLGNVKSNRFTNFSLVIPNISLKKYSVQVVHDSNPAT